VGEIGGVLQAVMGQGDGWVRGYEAKTGKKLWEFDTNPKDSVWPQTRNELISTPVIIGDLVYIANGQDPEHGEGVGHLYGIDAEGSKGDITVSGRVWHFGDEDFHRSISTVAVADGLLYAADLSGFLNCLDARTGRPYWVHDTLAAVWGSPTVIDGKVFLGDEDGDVVVLEHSKTRKLLAENNMENSVYTTPVAANGVLYIVNRTTLFAIARTDGAKPAAGGGGNG
jgi:outer membrane protein assembly factor BamB